MSIVDKKDTVPRFKAPFGDRYIIVHYSNSSEKNAFQRQSMVITVYSQRQQKINRSNKII